MINGYNKTPVNNFDNYTFVQIIVILSLQLVQFAEDKKQMKCYYPLDKKQWTGNVNFHNSFWAALFPFLFHCKICL